MAIRTRTIAAPTALSFESRKSQRAFIEDQIEALIAILDRMDGECDLEDTGDFEPSLGMAGCHDGHPDFVDLEVGEDDEPSLGWTDFIDQSCRVRFGDLHSGVDLEQNGDEQDCSHSEDEWQPFSRAPFYDGSGAAIAEELVKGLPTFWGRQTMKAMIAAGANPERSEIEIIRRNSRHS